MHRRSDDVLLKLTRRDLRMLVLGGLLAGAVVVPFWLRAAQPSLTTFTNGTVADAEAINGNFQALAAAMTAEGTTFSEFYAHGTWTPQLLSSATASAITWSTQKGWWVRFGDHVYVSLHLIGTVAAGGSGYLRIGGLPFEPWDLDPQYRSSGAVTYASGFTSAPVGMSATGTDDVLFLSSPTQDGNGLPWSAVAGRGINLQASVMYRLK